MKDALGLIEIQGLATAILVADTMVKTASVTIIQIEKTRGHGWITVKITGDVGAVNAAVSAGKQIGETFHHYISSKVIPRPSDSVEAVFCQTTKQAEKPVSPVESSPASVIEEEISKEHEEISEAETVETIPEAENHSVLEPEVPSESAVEQSEPAQEPITPIEEEIIRSEPVTEHVEPEEEKPVPQEVTIPPESPAETVEPIISEPVTTEEQPEQQPIIPPVNARTISEPEIGKPAVKTEPDSKKKAPNTAKATTNGTSSTAKNTNSRSTVVKEKNPSKQATRKPKGKKEK